MTILGIDVSAAQQHIDWVRVSRWIGAAGERVEFAIVKATEGNGKSPDDCDPQAHANALGAAACGLLLGFYHFAHPDTWHANDPVDEADHFVRVAVACGYKPSVHVLALDIEEARQVAKGQPFHDWVLAFLTHVTTITGRWCWLYSGGPFFDAEENGIVDPTLAEHPLWLAAYVPAPARDRFVPRPWHDVGPTLWQRGGDQAASDCSILRVDGIATNVDRDEYDGTIEELHALVEANIAAAPTDPAPAATPDGGSVHGLAIDHARDVEDEAKRLAQLGDDELADTQPDGAAARSQSSKRMQAVKAPILGVDDGPPTPRGSNES